MKPFLAIDLSENKNNENTNGGEFLIARPSGAASRNFENSLKQAEETVEKSKLPLPLRAAQTICGTAALIIALAAARGLFETDGISLSQAYENAPWLFWLFGVCLAIWAVLMFFGMKKSKSVLQAEESEYVFKNFEGSCEAVFSELSVPPDAKDVDILSFFYKVRDGKIKVYEKALQAAPYDNRNFKIFADSDNFYLAGIEGKYAFALSAAVSIITVKKRAVMMSWNKDEAYNKGIYKQYKLVEDNLGRVSGKNYHILELNSGGERWGIYFPCYELPVFEEITGFKADEQ